MKKYYLVLCTLLTIVGITSAQDLTMLSGNPLWTYGCFGNESDITVPVAKISDEYGLPEKDGRIYHQLFQIERLDIEWGKTVYTLYSPIAVREENGKVFLWYDDYKKETDWLKSLNRLRDVPIPYLQTSENELLFYDFTLKAGEKYPTSSAYDGIYVEKIDTIVTKDNVSRKLFTLTNGLQILEGIGCLNTPNEMLGFALLHYLYPIEAWVHGRSTEFNRLYEYEKNGQVIYRGFEVHTDVNNVCKSSSSKPAPSTHPWTDLSGRRLTTPPTRPGLYIRDGRKVMVK
jgi:hypothetical protein